MFDLNEVKAELALVNTEINELKKKRRCLMQQQMKANRYLQSGYNEKLDTLVRFVKENPGCDHQAILALFPEMDEREMTNFLMVARRNRSLIENRGTRAQPKWYVV